MVGTVIVFTDGITGEERQIEFVPHPGGYKVDIFDDEGNSILEGDVVIPRKETIELKNELAHIL